MHGAFRSDVRLWLSSCPVMPGDDRLEKAVLAYALAHPAAFSTTAEAAW
jgi:hypothetical protein